MAHSNRQGIAVLGFHTNNVTRILEKYKKHHPNLFHTFREYDDNDDNTHTKILEVFAYYAGRVEQETNQEEKGQEKVNEDMPDRGTVLRFTETNKMVTNKSGGTVCVLPGLKRLEATFKEESQAAYCDHWVSNVHSRTEFLKILEDTLGFKPKVSIFLFHCGFCLLSIAFLFYLSRHGLLLQPFTKLTLYQLTNKYGLLLYQNCFFANFCLWRWWYGKNTVIIG